MGGAAEHEVRLVLQLAVGLVFLASTLGKLRYPRAFARGVADYELIPEAAAYVLSWTLIPVEAFIAIAHLSGQWLPIAAPLGLITLLLFTAAVGINLARGRGLPCYCFGGRGSDTISWRSMVRLLLLIGAELVIILAIRSGPVPPSSPRDLVIATFWAVALMLGALWILSLDDLVQLMKRQPLAAARSAGSDAEEHPAR